MSQLAKLQSDFQAYLMDAGKGAAFKNYIVDDEKVGATRRLSIYADAYRLGILRPWLIAIPNLKPCWAIIYLM